MFWEAFLGIIIAVIIYNFIHWLLVVQPTQKTQLRAEQHCQAVLASLLQKMPANPYSLTITRAKVLSDVWGRGIQVFEFALMLDGKPVNNKIHFLNTYLPELLNQRAIDPSIHDYPMQITDLWEYHQLIHIEIAYLANQSTKEYVNDIHRLSE